jgi:hypothetical protein
MRYLVPPFLPLPTGGCTSFLDAGWLGTAFGRKTLANRFLFVNLGRGATKTTRIEEKPSPKKITSGSKICLMATPAA